MANAGVKCSGFFCTVIAIAVTTLISSCGILTMHQVFLTWVMDIFHVVPAFWWETPGLAFYVSFAVQIFYNKILAASWSVQLHLIIETCLSGLGIALTPNHLLSSRCSSNIRDIYLWFWVEYLTWAETCWYFLIFYEIFCSKMQQSSAAQPHPGKALGLQ